MLYQRSKTTNSPKRFILPLIPVLLALMLIAADARMPNVFSTMGHALASPIWHIRDSVYAGFGITTGSLESKEELFRENQRLREELAAQNRKNFVADALLIQNKELRTLLGRAPQENMYLPAAIINDAHYSPYDSFVIDLGEVDGLRNDMLVLTPEGIAIGTVTRTLKRTAVVTRFSAPDIELTVGIQASTSIHAHAIGQGGGTMTLSVPRDLQITRGNTVTLSNFPANPLGTVVSIDVAPEDAYQTVYVEHAVNLYTLQHVMIDLVHAWKPDEDMLDAEEHDHPSEIAP